MTDLSNLSVVVPSLNAAVSIEDTLEVLAASPPREVIVVDGGSDDMTKALALTQGATVIDAVAGRGGQLATGADAATGDWLLFLHADTQLADGWSDEIACYAGDPVNLSRAAAFRFALDDASPQARRVARLVAWRTCVLGLPYGDQGLLISRRFYDELGGYRPLPLMEDVDLVRRIGRRRLDLLQTPAVTSAVRYRRGGWWRRPIRNLCCLGLYFAGMPPRMIARIYR